MTPCIKIKIKHAEFRWLCNPYRHRLQSACICHSTFIEDPKPAAFTNESGVFFLIYSLNDYLWYLKQHVPPSINRSPFEGNSIWNANFLTGLISKGKEKKKIGYLYGSHKFNHIYDYQQIKCYHMLKWLTHKYLLVVVGGVGIPSTCALYSSFKIMNSSVVKTVIITDNLLLLLAHAWLIDGCDYRT